MQKSLLLFVTIFLFAASQAQKTEIQARLNSGLFKFEGAAAEKISQFNYSPQWNSAYTNNPFGSNFASCIGISGNIKRVTKSLFLYGADVGYEKLRSKTIINAVSTSTKNYTASGQSYLINNFINLHPFVGFRVINKKITLDFSGGFDIAFGLSGKEKGNAIAYTDTGNVLIVTNNDRGKIKKDIRPRLQLSAQYKKVGVYAGYSLGLSNYLFGSMGDFATFDAYSRLFRFGLSYQLK